MAFVELIHAHELLAFVVRQPSQCQRPRVGPPRQVEIRAFNPSFSQPVYPALSVRITPVSYTHLDVYKRQGLRCSEGTCSQSVSLHFHLLSH